MNQTTQKQPQKLGAKYPVIVPIMKRAKEIANLPEAQIAEFEERCRDAFAYLTEKKRNLLINDNIEFLANALSISYKENAPIDGKSTYLHTGYGNGCVFERQGENRIARMKEKIAGLIDVSTGLIYFDEKPTFGDIVPSTGKIPVYNDFKPDINMTSRMHEITEEFNPIVGAYCALFFADGTKRVRFIDKSHILNARRSSTADKRAQEKRQLLKQKEDANHKVTEEEKEEAASSWDNNFASMVLKTVLKRTYAHELPNEFDIKSDLVSSFVGNKPTLIKATQADVPAQS